MMPWLAQEGLEFQARCGGGFCRQPCLGSGIGIGGFEEVSSCKD